MPARSKKAGGVSFSNYAAAGYQRVSWEDAVATLQLPPERPAGLATLRRRVANWKRKALTKVKPATEFQQILEAPKRFVRLGPEDDVCDRPLLIFDKSQNEFFEFKPIGVRKFSLMSLAGVDWLTVTRGAEDWARSRCSGRKVRGDGRIF